MKSLFVVALAAVAAFLVACGGGGSSSSSGGGMPPTPAPVAYQAQIVFSGPMAGSQSGVGTLSVGREIQSMNRMPLAAGTPAPIMVLSAPNVEGGAGSSYGGTIQVYASPEPATPPAVTLSVTNPNAVITATPTPAPGQTPFPEPSGVVAVADVNGVVSATAQTAGTAKASLASPVFASASAQVYSYGVIEVNCIGSINPDTGLYQPQYPGDSGGWQWNGTAWVADNNPATSDIYVTAPSPGCQGAFVSSAPTLHAPYGATNISDDTDFAGISASQWTNAWTSIPASTLMTPNIDGSLNAIILFKTQSGAIAKLFPNAISSQGDIAGAIEVSGDSIDGF